MKYGVDIDANGDIHISGISIKSIANEYGTPVYVYDAEQIRHNFSSALTTFSRSIENFNFFYAIKACNNLNVANILTEMGAGIDAASPVEIMMAQSLGVPNEKIIFTGNNLSDDDIQFALNAGVIFNVDDHSILRRIFQYEVPEVMSFRINPGDDNEKKAKLNFGGSQAKFGIRPDSVRTAYEMAKAAGVKRFGAHMMPGSCALDVTYFKENTSALLEIVGPISSELNIKFDFIDLGGGLGIPYHPDEKDLDLDQTAAEVARVIVDKSKKFRLGSPRIFMEPARYFVGNAGYVIGRVSSIKDSYGIIIGTDVSMNILARPAMYDAYHDVLINERIGDPTIKAGLCGQVCENRDFWIKERLFPASVEVGDLILVKNAGAYGYSMSYQYNGRLRPAEVLIDGGKAALIRRREAFEDTIGNLVLHGRLKEGVSKILLMNN